MKNYKPKDPHNVVRFTLAYISDNLLEACQSRDMQLDPRSLRKENNLRYRGLPFRPHDDLTYPSGVEEWLEYVFSGGISGYSFRIKERAVKSIMRMIQLPTYQEIYANRKRIKQREIYAKKSRWEQVRTSCENINLRDCGLEDITREEINEYYLWGKKERFVLDSHNRCVVRYYVSDDGKYKREKFKYL